MTNFPLFTEAQQEVQTLLADDPGLLKPVNLVLHEVMTKASSFDEMPLAGA